jgi:putative endonuclease
MTQLDKKYFVYIMASRKNGILYVGMTNNLVRRVYEHKHKTFKGYTSKYKISLLVYFESFYTPYDAIVREKHIKKWKRAWKIRLIEKENPNWEDLYNMIKE